MKFSFPFPLNLLDLFFKTLNLNSYSKKSRNNIKFLAFFRIYSYFIYLEDRLEFRILINFKNLFIKYLGICCIIRKEMEEMVIFQ